MRIKPVKEYKAMLTAPPDKSVTHRAFILGALCRGRVVVENPLLAADTLCTLRAVAALGADAELKDGTVALCGGGLKGAPLFCGNSATAMRLLLGVTAALPGVSRLSGDTSLSGRPMQRVIEPLRLMGAVIAQRPLVVKGGKLRGVTYELPVASAQLKGALLLAGLSAEGETRLTGKLGSRDHTERMLKAMGADIVCAPDNILIRPGPLTPINFRVPGDASSAAYPLLLGLLTGGEVCARRVESNPTRLGFLAVLKRAGASVTVTEKESCEADITVSGRLTKPFEISAGEVPYVIDELPLLAVAACFIEGKSVIEGAGELRYKESDRLSAIVNVITGLGGEARITGDTLIVSGYGGLEGGEIFSRDHRIVMSAAVALAASRKGGSVGDENCVGVSYPRFFELFEGI